MVRVQKHRDFLITAETQRAQRKPNEDKLTSKIFDLSFDLVQDGELVEPFRISDFTCPVK